MNHNSPNNRFYILSTIILIQLLVAANSFAQSRHVIVNPKPHKQPTALRRPSINYDMNKALDYLDKFSWASTSPHFSNPNNYSIGLGKARGGVMYSGGKLTVSFETSISLRLSYTGPGSMSVGGSGGGGNQKGMTAVSISGIYWDKEKGYFTGSGHVSGKAYPHSPLDVRPARFKIIPWPSAPFKGAFYSIEAEFDMPTRRYTDNRIIKWNHLRLRLNRTFTVIETLRAMEHARDTWLKNVVDVRSLISKLEGYVTADKKISDDVRKKKLKAIERLTESLNRVDNLSSEGEWALKFGGSIHVGEKTLKFKKQPSLSKVDMRLLQLAGVVTNHANDQLPKIQAMLDGLLKTYKDKKPKVIGKDKPIVQAK